MIPTLALTMGDPAGIGPEICLKIATNPAFSMPCRIGVIGDVALLNELASPMDLAPLTETTLDQIHETEPGLYVIQGGEALTPVQPGIIQAHCGAAAYRYIIKGIDAAKTGLVDAVVTAPINKAALHAAGIHFPGHTEIFADQTGTDNFCMMQYSKKVTASFVTTHMAIADVPKAITPERLRAVIQLTASALSRIKGLSHPKLSICGLNPHAGEEGLFGDEERQVIIPVVEALRTEGMDLTGPMPPDTAFTPDSLKRFDGFVCMYHDQGHIPVKMLSFDCSVNTTLGPPIIRTSVDHGTAFDIVRSGQALDSSLRQAIEVALQLASKR